jgi:single-strand DNA-binding protein
MELNKVHLIGRITRDPETKALPSGKQVAKFGLATNRIYKDKDGKEQKSVQFHNCVAFGRLAEIAGQYLEKGQEVYVEGRIEYRTWERSEGGKGLITEIMVSAIQMGHKAKPKEEPEKPVKIVSGTFTPAEKKLADQEIPPEEAKELLCEEEEINVNDIPF